MSEASQTATKRSVRNVISDAQQIAHRQSTSARAVEASGEEASSLLQTNVFAHILLNPNLAPEAKRDELVKTLAFSKECTKDQNRAKLEAFSQFKEYLQEQRKLLNRGRAKRHKEQFFL